MPRQQCRPPPTQSLGSLLADLDTGVGKPPVHAAVYPSLLSIIPPTLPTVAPTPLPLAHLPPPPSAGGFLSYTFNPLRSLLNRFNGGQPAAKVEHQPIADNVGTSANPSLVPPASSPRIVACAFPCLLLPCVGRDERGGGGRDGW